MTHSKYLSVNHQLENHNDGRLDFFLGFLLCFFCPQAGFSMEEDMISEKCRFSEAVALCFEGARTNSLDLTLRVGTIIL